jgi:hypothetical protein
MEAARQILLSYQWRYVTPNFDKVIVFTADGLIKNVDGSPPVRQWQMIDGNSFIVRSANNSNVSNFNNDFTRFEGHTLKRPFKVYGSRLGRVQQTAPGKTGSSHHP